MNSLTGDGWVDVYNGYASSIVKDVARHGGDVTGMVPDCVIPLLGEALNNEKRA